MSAIMNISDGFNAYKVYLAIKQHFHTEYNYHRYHGRVRVSEEAYLKRRDRFFFRKLQKKYKDKDLITYYVSNFIKNGDKWIGNLLSEDSENNYIEYKKRQESLSYVFKNDLIYLKEKNLGNDLFTINSSHPPLLKFYMQGDICIETIIILDDKLSFMSYWNSKMQDIIWEDYKKLISNYRSFLQYDKETFFNIIKEIFNEQRN